MCFKKNQLKKKNKKMILSHLTRDKGCSYFVIKSKKILFIIIIIIIIRFLVFVKIICVIYYN